ncbi:tyrosine-type recombinase/integrase [Sphingoaurantiacus capsulatus]|uniref:Tyrosine-type recombinase/integrase n=1 Tax=Sphingoaurantiacus capsulatus TaxID=1771310 RepID=A0ABV7XHW1_9SPHN
MPKIKLDQTSAMLAQCEAGKKKTDFWDNGENCHGLVLEVRSSGGKTWYLRYQDRYGRQRQHKIGRYHLVSFEQVKKVARRLRAEVELGGDPGAEKKAMRAVPTYAELAQQHLEHAQTYQKSFATTEMIMRRHIKPRWGNVILSEIRQPDVAKWLASKANDGLAPATVEKIKVMFSRSFELAMQWEMPGVDKNPVRGIRRPPLNNARDRFLNTEEVRRLQRAVAESRNPSLKYIVGLLLLTGARVSELLNAEWRHVDIEREAWFIPTSKTGKSRYVPLAPEALNLIASIPRTVGSKYLLPNPDTGRPFTTIKHAWQTARKQAKIPDVRIHDLRHTAASFMVNDGIDLYAVGKVLGHASQVSTERYSHVANERLMAAVRAGAKQQPSDW